MSSSDDVVRADAGESEQDKRAREMEEALRAADTKKRADAEEAEKKAKADAEGTKLDKLLSHLDGIKSTCDAMSTRLDAFSKRMDALDGGSGEERRALAAPAADARADAAKARADADAKRRADHDELCGIQARADEGPFNALGLQAPRPFDGETPEMYDVRLCNLIKMHSPAWNEVDLAAVAKADPKAFATARAKIYADAIEEGLHPTQFPNDALREIITPDASGRRIRTFQGRRTFIHALKMPSRFLVGINTRAADHAP